MILYSRGRRRFHEVWFAQLADRQLYSAATDATLIDTRGGGGGGHGEARFDRMVARRAAATVEKSSFASLCS